MALRDQTNKKWFHLVKLITRVSLIKHLLYQKTFPQRKYVLFSI